MESKQVTSFTTVVWKEGKHYVAQALNVDVSSFGKTYEKALMNLNEALELYLEDAPKSVVQQIESPSLTFTTPHFSYA